jgi:hypothetical protein
VIVAKTTAAALEDHCSRHIPFFEYLWWPVCSGKGKVVSVLKEHIIKTYGIVEI